METKKEMTQKVKLTKNYKKQGVGVGHARIVEVRGNKWKMGTVRMRKREKGKFFVYAKLCSEWKLLRKREKVSVLL
jgi:hypothetical protein